MRSSDPALRPAVARVLLIAGTRPEIIKLAPVYRCLRATREIDPVLCVSGQHRELVHQALGWFDLVPDFDLEIMRPGQTLSALTARLLPALDDVIAAISPAWVVVQGDTTTAMAGALAAFYRQVPLAHVEAGLRTGDLSQPFPEEANRQIVDMLAAICFAPTTLARQRLLDSGTPADRVHVTGNTVIDAANDVIHRQKAIPAIAATLPADRRWVLVTMHRRESFGEPLRRIISAIRALARRFGAHTQFIVPVHPNPHVLEPVRTLLAGEPACSVVAPLDYPDLLYVLSRCALVLTDSGGIQEEAPAFQVPVLVLRQTTERPEGVDAGFARLVGQDPAAIIAAAEDVLLDRAPRAEGRNPYGDGRASERIADVLCAAVRQRTGTGHQNPMPADASS